MSDPLYEQRSVWDVIYDRGINDVRERVEEEWYGMTLAHSNFIIIVDKSYSRRQFTINSHPVMNIIVSPQAYEMFRETCSHPTKKQFIDALRKLITFGEEK